MLRRWLRPTGWKIGLTCAVFSLGVWALRLPFLYDIELKTVDARFRLRGERPVSGDVVIAAIDARSVDVLGRWPWPRSDLARVIDALHALGARVVALDIVFSEPERGHPESDRRLADAIRRAGNVVLGYFFRIEEGATPGTRPKFGLRRHPPSRVLEVPGLEDRLRLVSGSRLSLVRVRKEPRNLVRCDDVEPNIPGISSASDAMGFFSIQPDPDGVVRRVPTLFACGRDYFGSLSLRTVSRFWGDAPVAVEMAEDGVRSLRIGGRPVAVNEGGFLRVNFPGPAHAFHHYSAIDLIRKHVPREAIRGKIVLVGPTELGIEDIRATPFSAVVPGVEVQAAAVETMLHGTFLRRTNVTTLLDVVIVLLMGVGFGALLQRLSGAVLSALIAVAALTFLVAVEAAAFGRSGVQMNVLYPTLCLLLTYVSVAVYKAFGVERQRRELRRLFESYMSPAVVERIVENPDRIVLAGERRDVTVLFSDIEGFTTMSEKLEPEEVVHLLNAYLTPMTELVFQHSGILDKYIGDAVMAIFGAPIDLADHADQACRTALEMIRALSRLKDDEWLSRGWPDIRIRIGINSGPMAVGDMGSSLHRDYTAIGDGVNLASRLEDLSKTYGTRILLSEFTRERLVSPFVLREIDIVQVRGRREPVRVYELRSEGTAGGEEAAFIQSFEKGLTAFRARAWDEARGHFRACLKARPEDGPAAVMLARCDAQEKAAPAAPRDEVEV